MQSVQKIERGITMNKNVYVSLVKWAQEISADENTNIAGFFLLLRTGQKAS